MPANRDKKNQTSFKPGKSGNPQGRPKTPDTVKLAFANMMPLALAALSNILDGTDTDAKASDRIKASDIVFDRNLGKAIQQVDADVNVNQIISINKPDFADDM